MLTYDVGCVQFTGVGYKHLRSSRILCSVNRLLIQCFKKKTYVIKLQTGDSDDRHVHLKL